MPQKLDVAAIMQKVRANQDKLRKCKRHRFEETAVELGQNLVCLNCRGELGMLHVDHYIRGYEAAGGIASDIWPAWAHRHERNAPNVIEGKAVKS